MVRFNLDNETRLIHMFSICRNIVDLFPMQTWCALRQVSKGLSKALLDPGMEKLLPHQRAHARHLRLLLQTERRGIDTSPLGAGKSYVGCYLAKQLSLVPLILGPNACETNWKQAAAHFGLSNEFYQYSVFQRKKIPFTVPFQPAMDVIDLTIDDVSQEKLETQETKKPIIPLVDTDEPSQLNKEWNGIIQGLEHKQTQLVLSPEWRQALQQPILLILDECHLLKNDCKRTRILTMMVRSLFEFGHPRSAVLLASATPFDRPVHPIRLMRLLNIWESDRLAIQNPQRNRQEYRGFQEILDYAQHINPSRYPLNFTGFIQTKAYKCIMQRIYPKLVSSMYPYGLPFVMDAQNLFYDLSGPELRIVREGVQGLEDGITSMYLPHLQGDELGKITKALQQIERGKIGLFVMCARKILEQTNNKVILFVNFRDTLRQTRAWLADYNPLIISGDTKMADRPGIIAQFQEPNLRFRLLIGNLSILAQGQDLDDQDGRFPRHLIVSPSYFLSRLHQSTGRILRSKTKSQPRTHFIYVKQVPTETNLLSSLALKSKVLQQSVKHRMVLPSQYPSRLISQETEFL